MAKAAPAAPVPPFPDPQLEYAPNPLFNWMDHRGIGVLLHPTSFPGTQGIGTLEDGPIDAWLRFLSSSGMRYWQICPLGPTGYGDSPYQCFSAFAGNPYLIDLTALHRHGLLKEEELTPLRELPADKIDYGWLYVTKWPALFHAFEAFRRNPEIQLPYGDFTTFRKTHASWLESFSLFQALKDYHRGIPWWEWPPHLRFFKLAKEAALPESVKVQADAHAFFQYLFFGQWNSVRMRAAKLGIEVIGDAPIFVARDSADVWANPKLFLLDEKTGHPLVVAGVPPDYFSADGQHWGNPLYAWSKHAETGYAWWLDRLRANFQMCDVLRIDHFRAFDTYWSIPANAPTAKTGKWENGPGLDFFKAVKNAMPQAKLIAEDLGDLFPSVTELREATGLPGMTILQFAFGGKSDNLYLPHNLKQNSVVYPGTHDNDTTLGWFNSANDGDRDHVRRYLRVGGDEVGWDFIRVAYRSVSNLAIIPLQDFLSLGSEARFNTPGRAVGNWQWRYKQAQLDTLTREAAGYLRSLGDMYGRLNESPKPRN